MKILLDTGVWFRRYHRLPLKPSLVKFLASEAHEFHLSPLSVAEIVFKWRRGRLPGIPHPAEWVDHSLENFLLVHPSPQAARRAGSWDWDHGDLVDRLLAAIAAESDLLLIHTDRVLKKLSGFPQRYFPAAHQSR
jgi:PIN domain nuclease of toxin-antitoxin system